MGGIQAPNISPAPVLFYLNRERVPAPTREGNALEKRVSACAYSGTKPAQTKRRVGSFALF